MVFTFSNFQLLLHCLGKSLNCKREEIVTRSIIDSIDSRTKNINNKKLNGTVILLLDENFVITENAIKKSCLKFVHLTEKFKIKSQHFLTRIFV